MVGKLIVVATPIGNLADFTYRAIETLKQADFVLCEDTRTTSKLLVHFGITTSARSYHQHSTLREMNKIIDLLKEGKNLALVTDAGTPGISDPGNLLIQEILKVLPDTEISVVPGASAVVAALSISGFPADKFVFMGFPPHKTKRQKYFEEVAGNKYTTVFYESSHRIKKAIDNLVVVLEPERKVCICRELTKKFETVYRGTINEIKEMKIEEKGEFVVIVN